RGEFGPRDRRHRDDAHRCRPRNAHRREGRQPSPRYPSYELAGCCMGWRRPGARRPDSRHIPLRRDPNCGPFSEPEARRGGPRLRRRRPGSRGPILEGMTSAEALNFLAGGIAAALVGFLAIWGMLRFLQRQSTHVFVYYRIAFGLVLFGLLIWR